MERGCVFSGDIVMSTCTDLCFKKLPDAVRSEGNQLPVENVLCHSDDKKKLSGSLLLVNSCGLVTVTLNL